MKKTVLVTGGSRGIGKAICEKFESEGYKVIKPTREELDLTNEESITNFIKKNKNVSVDILINNAGCNEISLVENITDEEIDKMMNLNLITPLKLIRAFVPLMKKNKFGRIVNIGSIWAVVSKSGRCVYSATKNGIHGITNTLAVELAEYNILVNTVCPGFTLTELTRKNNNDEQIKEICKEIPMGRMAQPEEIANVVFFVGNEKNTYLTGQKITVDGGFTER